MKEFKEIIESGTLEEFKEFLEANGSLEESEEVELVESGDVEKIKAYVREYAFYEEGDVALVKLGNQELIDFYTDECGNDLCDEAQELLDKAE